MADDLAEKREKLIKNIKDFFKAEPDEKDEMAEERKKAMRFIKEKKEWVIYIILAGIIWFSTYVRVQNLNILKDVTTGKYIPQALDPHLFLRYTQYIVEHGSLMVNDPSRFVPVGASTAQYVFMSSFVAYLYKIINLFIPSVTVEYVFVIYPAICFAVAMVFFFLLVRRLFDWKVGLLSTLFLSIVPAFLHRTMSGFSDHEALGVMFTFMAMYFFVRGWQSKSIKWSVFFGVVAGIFTGLEGLTWGGWKFLILIISIFTLIEFFFDKIERKDVYQYLAWVATFFVVTTTWIPVFSLKLMFTSFTTGIAFLVLFMLLVDLVIFDYDWLKLKRKFQKKLPLGIVSFAVSLVLGLVLLIVVFGPSSLTVHAGEIADSLLHPMGNDRWQLTVAEQHQPYFANWVEQFGPLWFKVPLYLVLFVVGSILLFYNMVRENKNSFMITAVYTIFILAFMMSRYSPSSTFNGVSFISIATYVGSLLLFGLLVVIFYLHSFYKEHNEFKKILSWSRKYIFVLVWFIIMIVAARGAARLMFIFAPITALMAGYCVVELSQYIFAIKKKAYMITAGIVLLLILVNPFTFPGQGVINIFAKSVLQQAKYSGPGYNQQWQIAGQWARENIPEDAVFGHWWDYGYWVQTGFGRATVLDGANKIKYWNYLMGRHVLTGQTQEEALEFLKVHDTTHYLIVSDEIGKYTAYSSIGSDRDYDRYSWITTFQLNPQGIQETRNTTVYMYQGGHMLDDDFVWEGRVFPRRGSGIGAVFLPVKKMSEQVGEETIVNIEFEQPVIALVSNGQRVDVPLECLYFNGKMMKFSKPGYKGCFRLIPTLQGDGRVDNPIGAGMFLSEEAVKALWVNLYVLEQNNPNYDTSAFKLVYEDNYISNIVLYGGRLMGPIKIWEINYPENFTVDEETKAKYLGGNEMLPDYFFEVN